MSKDELEAHTERDSKLSAASICPTTTNIMPGSVTGLGPATDGYEVAVGSEDTGF